MSNTSKAARDSAGAIDRLLNREPPPGYIAEWTAHIGAPVADTRRTLQQVMIFKVSGEHKALPAHLLHEVAEDCPFHTLPNRSAGALKGLVNVRGSLQTCFSLDALLRTGSAATQSAEPVRVVRRVLLVDLAAHRIALEIDDVCAVARVHEHEMRPVPATLTKAEAQGVRGMIQWNEHNVAVLNEDALVNAIREYFR